MSPNQPDVTMKANAIALYIELVEKALIFLLFLYDNLSCEYSSDVFQWGTSNE